MCDGFRARLRREGRATRGAFRLLHPSELMVMNGFSKCVFYFCMVLTVSSMIFGHWVILSSGSWFIPGREKYNIFTRWVSDFAAVWPLGLWIKGSIVSFCVALFIFMRARLEACGAGLRNHVLWFWNAILAFGMISGLLLVALYDMSPPQFSVKEPSWLGRILGEEPVIIPESPGNMGYIREGHHRVGFLLFIISFAMTLATAAVEKWKRDSSAFRKDVFYLMVTGLFMIWLMAFHQSYAGIPQRVLLITIFLWVWTEGGLSRKKSNRHLEQQPIRS